MSQWNQQLEAEHDLISLTIFFEVSEDNYFIFVFVFVNLH